MNALKDRGTIVAVSVSSQKGEKKHSVDRAQLKEDFGIVGDAHAGNWHRQISLLAEESIVKMREKGLDVGSGDFAENITTRGMELLSLKVKDRVRIGEQVLLEITQIGKECHKRCNIFYQAGDCVMPKEGIFARVLTGGIIESGNEIWKDPLTQEPGSI